MSFLSLTDILALRAPSLPSNRRGLERLAIREGWQGDTARARRRQGQGGGWEYHVDLLPEDARAEFLALTAPVPEAADDAFRAELWRRFEALPEKTREKARQRLTTVDRVGALNGAGRSRDEAVRYAADEAGVSASTVWSWLRLADSVSRADRLAALAPRHRGRSKTAQCDPRAWDFFKSDYLRPEKPAASACYRRLLEEAEIEGWGPVPSEKTMLRRIEREVPAAVRVLARDGREAARRLYPHQTRDRSVFHAMQAVNADGHQFDVFVTDGEGKPFRPVMVAIQDLYSGMIVAHRVDRSETAHQVRLAIGDMVESFGIPEAIYLDNGRGFAAKWISGGAPTRYRFKVQPGEPTGVLTELGVRIHWTTPYSGQSKPIERAFLDLAEEISRHPRCAGAYTGNAPHAKPDNHGSRAVPFDDFKRLVAERISRHNLREGRRGATVRGGSFAGTFRQSLMREETLVRRPTAEQRRLWLLAAENVTARRPRGEIQLQDNRYWAPELVGVAGQRIGIRFDPENLHGSIEVYDRDGRHLCTAPCIEATGFNDAAAAREHAQARRAYQKALRQALELEQLIDLQKAMRRRDAAPPAEDLPERRVVAMATGRVMPVTADDYETRMEALGRGIRALSSAEIVEFQGGGDD